MKRKHLIACGLAAVTALALCAPAAAFAAADSGYNPGATASQDKTFGNVDGSKASTTAPTITGTITPTTITAGVPTTAAFGIDPWKAATSPTSQITAQSTNFKIVNLSKFPIFTRITNVAVAAGTNHAGVTHGKPTLKSGAPSAAGDLQLAIKNTAPANFTTAADWLAEGSLSYKVKADDKIAAAASDGTGTEMAMTIAGQMNGTGWASMDTFTVTPTFTIQAVAF